MKKFTSLLLATVMVMVLIAGCSTTAPGEKTSTDGNEGTTTSSNKIGLSVSTLNNPFFVSLKEGAEQKAKELGMELIVVDAQNDAAKQASDVEDLIQKKVGILLINPTDSDAVSSIIKSANKAQIPVITLDRSANGGEVVSHIASDNAAGGEMAGQYMLELVGKGANVVQLEGVPGSSAARERGAGFEKAIGSDLNVVAKQTANFDRAQGLSVMENILQGNKNIKGVFAQNDEMALGALQAIKAAGLKDIVVIGFDATSDAVAAVKNKEMSATVAQKPELIGSVGIESAKRVLNGEKVEAFVPVPLELIK
ncbi:ribose ABC transporter substrate-binding protein RbsB [Paenibacillus albiflavus]|uniref:Ribose ABC transporter substrate-binding protein RbsB n=1 Tax=Paenibacillus albiflavus TaxID=2545760 RepID=A0A4R4EQG5_9BACL|nr:ribose ABC transporter substrate-binding protein RbsB [Paenibacillus albiflavus]TCZ80831.1 ribose ABC transporter substrate-binding protein RbsB [Paenibacillus albiflavus]